MPFDHYHLVPSLWPCLRWSLARKKLLYCDQLVFDFVPSANRRLASFGCHRHIVVLLFSVDTVSDENFVFLWSFANSSMQPANMAFYIIRCNQMVSCRSHLLIESVVPITWKSVDGHGMLCNYCAKHVFGVPESTTALAINKHAYYPWVVDTGGCRYVWLR